MTEDRKSFTIDGNDFRNLRGFYNVINKTLCPGLRMGRNLDAFDDVLTGGFEVHECEEPIELVWENSEKSRRDLGPTFDELVEVIRDAENVSLILWTW